jgi:hypothetical protein
VPLTEHLQLGTAFALSQALAGYVDPEGRIFFAFRL